jgi:protein-disulfide isomerase
MKKEAIVLGVIAVVVIVVGIVLFRNSAPDPRSAGTAVDANSLIRTHSQRSGPDNAKATLVEFGDFQCPACGAAHPVIKAIQEANKDKSFQFVFRNFPLSQHQNAMLASEVAESAGNQGKYWEMHNKIYESQAEWSESSSAREIFTNYAKGLGLDLTKFNNDLDKHTFAEIIKTDMADGNKLGVNATPTFYFNGQKLDRTPSAEELQKMIDNAQSATASTTTTSTPSTQATSTTSTLFQATTTKTK